MEKTIRIVRILKWFFPLPGLFLFFWTLPAFGRIGALLTAAGASMWFWIIMSRGENQLISQGIASELGRAIRRLGDPDHMIEIRKIRSGVVARVYLIGKERSLDPVRRSVSEYMEHSGLRKYLWVMQMAQMSSPEELTKTRMLMNRELLKAIQSHKQD